MKTFSITLIFLIFFVSCKKDNNENLIQETWKITVKDTKPLRVLFSQQNRILNEIYGNLSELKKEENIIKLDSVKVLRLKIIKDSERNLIQLRKQSKIEENGKIIIATINLLVSLLEVENTMPNVYDKAEKNITNKFAPINQEFLSSVKKLKKSGENYDAAKDEFYEKNKMTIETSL